MIVNHLLTDLMLGRVDVGVTIVDVSHVVLEVILCTLGHVNWCSWSTWCWGSLGKVSGQVVEWVVSSQVSSKAVWVVVAWVSSSHSWVVS